MTKTGGRAIIARERELVAIEKRKLGWSYRQIAAHIGVSEPAVVKMVQKTLARIAAQVNPDAENIRVLELERLDSILEMHITKAREGDAKSAEVVIRVGKRRSELLGLDAPKTTITLEAELEDIDAQIEQLRVKKLTASITGSGAGSQIPDAVDLIRTPRTIDAGRKLE